MRHWSLDDAGGLPCTLSQGKISDDNKVQFVFISMKLVKVQFHNFRSACEALTQCTLIVEPDITCLIGSSESGKSNLLEAMEKFEAGGFTIDDVPRRLLSGNTSPSPDLQILSVTYELDDFDDQRLHDIVQGIGINNNSLTLSRNYCGPIHTLGASERSYEQIGEEIAQRSSDIKEHVERFLRAYNRQRKRVEGASQTQSCSLRLHRFLDAVEERQFGSKDTVSEISDRFERFQVSFQNLTPAVVERIPARTRTPASQAMAGMKQLVDGLLSATGSGLIQLLASRPSTESTYF